MSIEGRITVDALFHDRSGDDRLKVLSLASSKGYTTGAVAFVTGTAGTASRYIEWAGYRNAAGELVEISNPYAISFAWSGSAMRTLNDAGSGDFRLMSRNGEAAICTLAGSQPVLQLATAPGGGTGTYSVLIWGE
jgi:hypothetical protein